MIDELRENRRTKAVWPTAGRSAARMTD